VPVTVLICFMGALLRDERALNLVLKWATRQIPPVIIKRA
jgi:hypothetical protein